MGPLGFGRRNYSENIDEQKRDLELEQRRRHQEDMEHRSNVNISLSFASLTWFLSRPVTQQNGFRIWRVVDIH